MIEMLNYKIILVCIVLLILVIFENIFPKEIVKFKTKIKRTLKNIFLWLLNIGLTPILILPLTIAATSLNLHNYFIIEHTIAQFLFHLIIYDIFLYFWHRANHEIPFLWRFHHVHHLDETLDVSSGIRFHFGEVILSTIVRCIIIIMFNISRQLSMSPKTLQTTIIIDCQYG